MRYILFLISAFFFADTVALTVRKSFTFGYLVMFTLTVMFFLLAVFYSRWRELTRTGIMKYFRIMFISGWIFVIGMTLFIMSKSETNVAYNEDAVIVLGCGLNSDGSPSETLKNRLDGCISYYSENPHVYIVVSGGYDRHADITEGEGMKEYLLDKGIPESKILVEDQSRSTRENFELSKRLLTDNNISSDSIVYITNSFHIYRSGIYAEQAGFTNANPLRVKTDLVVYVPALLREILAVCAVKLLNY